MKDQNKSNNNSNSSSSNSSSQQPKVNDQKNEKTTSSTSTSTNKSSNIGTSGNFTYTWFQNPSSIFITLISKGEISQEKTSIRIDKARIFLQNTENHQIIFELHFCNAIDPTGSNFQLMGTVITFNLKKEIEGFNWIVLERAIVNENQQKSQKNWEEIDKKLKNDCCNEENDLFKQIYDKGDDLTKNAMKTSMGSFGGNK